jgi:hypothetical protein
MKINLVDRENSGKAHQGIFPNAGNIGQETPK